MSTSTPPQSAASSATTITTTTTTATANTTTQADTEPPAPTNKRWGPRRRGACGMCKLKKVRCDGATPCKHCKRHNQDCQYQLSKKRQPSNNSVSLPSDIGSEALAYCGEIHDASADILVESPHGTRLSPDLALSSVAGRLSFSTEGLNNNLHGMMIAANDQHPVHIFPDAYTDDASWAACMDWAGNHNSTTPPPASLSDPHGSCAITSWPSSTTTADSDYYLASPFTIERSDSSTGLSSTSLSDMDLTPFSNGHIHDQSSTKSWGELMSYMSFDEKVSKASITDHVPSIDFSLSAMFSPLDRGLENISNAKQDEISRIFRRISHVQAQQSPDFDNEQTVDSWYWNDRALMESCRLACFQEPLGISNFLTRSCFDNYVQEARASPEASSTIVPLIDSVMAFGFQALLASLQHSTDFDAKNKAILYSKSALRSREGVLRSSNTLLKLQTILAMATIADQIDDTIYTELLAGAVSCARALRLVNRDLKHKTTSQEEQYLARRSLWYLYSIEVPHSLRNGIPSALDHDWIDYAPPQAGKETDWLPLQCQYANALTSAAQSLYCQKALRQSLEDREQSLERAYKRLETWRLTLPAHLQDIHKHDMGGRALDDQRACHVALSMVRKYHEAIFVIFFPWTGAQSRVMISENCRRRSMELCVNSAQAVLAIATKISRLDMLDSSFLSLISVSICITFLDMVSSSGSKKSIPYLSMGCGIFGRLSLENELPLADVLELTRIAQRLKAGLVD